MSKVLLFLLLIILLGFGFYGYQKLNTKKPTELGVEKVVYPAAETEKPDPKQTESWVSYSEPSGIFSLKYPEELEINKKSAEGTTFSISVLEFTAISADAESKKEALEAGKLGKIESLAYTPSAKVISLDNGKVFAQSYMILQADKCTPKVIRKLLFFYGSKGIQITYELENPVEKIPAAYLTTNSSCQLSTWGDQELFYTNLAGDKLPGDVQNFYNQFSEIIKSIKITGQ